LEQAVTYFSDLGVFIQTGSVILFLHEAVRAIMKRLLLTRASTAIVC